MSDPSGRVWWAAATVILVALGPFASFAAENKQQYVDLSVVSAYAAGAAVVALILGAGAARVLRVSPARALLVTAVVLAGVFSFDVVQAASGPLIGRTILAQLIAWTVATTLIAALVGAIRDPRIGTWAVVVAGAFALPPLVDLAHYRVQHPERVRSLVAAEYRFQSQPNVYFFVLDGYLRPDLLPTITGSDDRAFVSALRQRGFTNLTGATANYPVTWLSLGSTLSLDYVQLPESAPYTAVSAFHDIMRGRNRVVETFRANGYKYVHVGSGHAGGACTGDEDRCIESPAGTSIDELELALMRKTPAYVLIERFHPEWLQETATNTWTQIHQVQDEIADVDVRSPFFVFAQFLAPHPPFLWRSDCSPQPAGLSIDLNRWSTEAIPHYVEAIECVNARILRLIDVVLADDPGAVVVLQSDHGSSFFVDWQAPLDRWTQRAVQERMSPLATVRLPARCHEMPYPTMSLVNTMRLVFSCLAGTSPNYLEDRWFVSPDSDHPDFGQVVEIGRPEDVSAGKGR